MPYSQLQGIQYICGDGVALHPSPSSFFPCPTDLSIFPLAVWLSPWCRWKFRKLIFHGSGGCLVFIRRQNITVHFSFEWNNLSNAFVSWRLIFIQTAFDCSNDIVMRSLTRVCHLFCDKVGHVWTYACRWWGYSHCKCVKWFHATLLTSKINNTFIEFGCFFSIL